jgi:hypothetical protein
MALTVEPYKDHVSVFRQRLSVPWTYLFATPAQREDWDVGEGVGVGVGAELDGTAGLLSRAINGQRKVGGGVWKGRGPAATGCVVAMSAKAERMAGEGKRDHGGAWLCEWGRSRKKMGLLHRP